MKFEVIRFIDGSCEAFDIETGEYQFTCESVEEMNSWVSKKNGTIEKFRDWSEGDEEELKEFFETCQSSFEEHEDYWEDYDIECGFNPYAGCYDFDC